MTTIQIFIMMMAVHFAADFALQTHDQATKKGEGKSFWNKWLAYHVGVYTLFWGLTFLYLPVHPAFQNIYGLLIFVTLIGVPHYFVDWATSRLSKPFFNKADFHNGFVVIGFDQVLHALCLLPVLLNILVVKV